MYTIIRSRAHMNLLYSITCSLPDDLDYQYVNMALTQVTSLFNGYVLQLHGSWMMGLAFKDSDIDIAVLINSNTNFQKIVNRIKSRMPHGIYKNLRMREPIVDGEMRVIPLLYVSPQSRTHVRIDVTVQLRQQMELVHELNLAIQRYGFHDLYRSIKIVLQNNNLYGHKVGGLNSFSIGWMIVVMIEYYRTHTNLLELYPNWFMQSNDEAHTYTLLAMFCEFYMHAYQQNCLFRLRREIPDHAMFSIESGEIVQFRALEIDSVQLNTGNWKDVKQPWLPRIYLDNHWITNKSWRYNYILALFDTILRECKSQAFM